MAKVKAARQRITAFLQAKGYDATEIKDAFDELDAADVDLDTLAEATVKNKEWVQWYQGVMPEVQSALSERDTLKQQLAQLEAAGIKVALPTQSQHTQDKLEEGKYVTPADLAAFKQDLVKATSVVMKDLSRVSMRHFKEFGEEPDINAIEELVSTKGYTVEDAYDFWSRPKRDERSAKDVEEKIKKGIQEGIQAELSKQGIRRTRSKADNDVERAPLDKDAPSESVLRDAFLKDLDEAVTH